MADNRQLRALCWAAGWLLQIGTVHASDISVSRNRIRDSDSRRERPHARASCAATGSAPWLCVDGWSLVENANPLPFIFNWLASGLVMAHELR